MVTLSVLLPNYNHEKYLGEALDAILCQSFQPMEIIVIDDASTDNSLETIQQFVDRYPHVHLIRNEKNMGLLYNLNKLLELAQGKYICFPAADDKLLPGFFEKSLNLLMKYPQAGLCSTLSNVIDEEGRYKGLLRTTGIISTIECFISPQKAQSILQGYGNWVLGSTAIYNRNILKEAGGFIPQLYSFADGFIEQVIALRYGVCFIPEPLGCWRKMDSGYHLSSSRNPAIQLQIIDNATGLMENAYKDLFSTRYVHSWRKKQLFLLNLNLWLSAKKNVHDTLIELRPAKSFFDKILFAGLNIFEKFEFLLVTLYFLIIYRYLPTQVIRRNVVSFFRRIRLRLKYKSFGK